MNLPFYDNTSDTQNIRVINLPPTCLIVIEGVFLQRKEWKDIYDYTLYIDCSREERFSREHKNVQNNIEKFIKRYWKAEEYYINTEYPEKQANLIIRN